MAFDLQNTRIQSIHNDVIISKKVAVDVLRLDEIHPVVSGNKLFKLHYFLEEAKASSHKTILTFGGAWSNHLQATAYACQQTGIKSIGIVRGEEPPKLSFALQECIRYGMRLKFLPRGLYARKESHIILNELIKEFGGSTIVPEGGSDIKGSQGARMIMESLKENSYSHIISAIGTATTISGLLMGAKKDQTMVGVPVLKGMNDIEKRIEQLTGQKFDASQLAIIDGYHFGGYAKFNESLINFMNSCWAQFQLPLDFVYTAKMLFAAFDQIGKGIFPEGSRILCIHTGGLAGNRSLPENTLMF
jgi:1-aminocyclopropane-1-carboxylate deaminase/D-cysteine desulfhydrase-like pyridoxal-dependent ACC family enzyme